MRVQYDLAVIMRDGVRLSADVYLPGNQPAGSSGRFPVVLQRTPYNNNSEGVILEARFYTSHGYAYVAQDCRGKFDSDGTWYPYIHEARDGDDTLTWCGTADWSTGRVGMSGGSYCGAVQWYAAATGNPYLKCIIPLVAYSDLFFDHGLRRNGVFQTFYIHWTAAMAGRAFVDIDKQQGADAVWHVPLLELDKFLGLDLPHWRDLVSHESYDDFWRSISIRERYKDVDIPALNVGGWHSPWELRGTLAHFTEMTRNGRQGRASRHQKLIVGPWTHSVNQSTRVGDFDFGLQSIIDLQQIQLRWFDRWLKEEENHIENEPPVSIYVMGANDWRHEAEWPLQRAAPTILYLRSDGRANSLFGDGRLAVEPPPEEEPPDRFTYNPERPVPSMISEAGNDESLFSDQRPIERRDDVLVYTSDVLGEDTEVTGPISLTLFASSSALDTDLTAMLLDVQPDGYSKPLTWGIARGRYLKSYSDPSLLEPGQVNEWTIDLWATSNVFRAGHRIRLDVSSSFFPFFGRNHNTGNPAAIDVEFEVAHQELRHSAAHPSHLILPVIPRSQAESQTRPKTQLSWLN